MCGIYGQLTTSEPDIRHAERSTDFLSHRSPDDSGTVLRDNVFLGMRRLSIIDLSGGRQSIRNAEQSCFAVYNGELQNFFELRPGLESRGHCFRTQSDTEVVLHAYEERGPDCLRRFNGTFAFAIWDERANRPFLARDRIGEKPLYYYYDSRRLIFGCAARLLLKIATRSRSSL
jgi:asparagine synthase (glutamine-hydrolysing)